MRDQRYDWLYERQKQPVRQFIVEKFAEELAGELAELPQACLRSDRRSAYDALGLDERAALASEFGHGLAVLPEAAAGAARFASGAGRGGAAAQ